MFADTEWKQKNFQLDLSFPFLPFFFFPAALKTFRSLDNH